MTLSFIAQTDWRGRIELNKEIEEILKEARFARKSDYHTYEYFKARLYLIKTATSVELDEAVKKLMNILKV